MYSCTAASVAVTISQKQTAAAWPEGNFSKKDKVTDDNIALLAQRWMMAVEDMDDDDELCRTLSEIAPVMVCLLRAG